MQKLLEEIVAVLPEVQVVGDCDKIIKDITADSREVREGSLFICLKGAHVDGHKYLEQAAASGAGAALVEDVPEVCPDGLTLLKVADTRLGMEVIAPFFYDYPGKTMRMIGVTGTNGKTTTTNIVRAILRKAGFKVGLIGTINIMIEDEAIVAHNTTPDVVDLQRALYRMKEAGCEYVVMEVSSHALALNRVAGCEYDTAALTNITQDHLDFHKTLENYRDAKGLLFEHLHEGKNENKIQQFLIWMMQVRRFYATAQNTRILTYGEGRNNDIYPLFFKVEAKQCGYSCIRRWARWICFKITGEFNVYNVYVLFKSSIYAVFIVNNRLFTVCLPCLHFQILYVYIFYAYASLFTRM